MKIEHVAMYVKDLEAAKDFFVTYFGAKPNEGYYNKTTGFRSCFLTFEDGARMEIMNRGDAVEYEKKLAHMGFIHVAFSAGSKEKVDALTNRLLADGYSLISGPRVTGDGYYESCVLDLEGNQLEITV